MENNPTLLLVVAAALTNETGAVLLQERPEGKAMAGLWEFPGGKVDPGELPENALARELQEELGIAVELDSLAPMAFVSHPVGERQMILLLYLCNRWSGKPEGLESQRFKWVLPKDMEKLPMPPADVPLVEALKKLPSSS